MLLASLPFLATCFSWAPAIDGFPTNADISAATKVSAVAGDPNVAVSLLLLWY
jgi:hypothetical protein